MLFFKTPNETFPLDGLPSRYKGSIGQVQTPLRLYIRDLFVAGIYSFQGFFWPGAEKSSRRQGEGLLIPLLILSIRDSWLSLRHTGYEYDERCIVC